MEISKKVIKEGLDVAYKNAGHHAYFGNGFNAGVEFALSLINKDELLKNVFIGEVE